MIEKKLSRINYKFSVLYVIFRQVMNLVNARRQQSFSGYLFNFVLRYLSFFFKLYTPLLDERFLAFPIDD